MGGVHPQLGSLDRGSVPADWLFRLSGDRQELFDKAIDALDASYGMLSVVLDDAIRLRSQAELVRARAQAGVAVEFVIRLADQLLAVLEALRGQGKVERLLPSVVPFTPKFFRQSEAHDFAEWHNLLHLVLLNGRLRYFHKLNALRELVEGLVRSFRLNATDIAEGTTVVPVESWEQLDHLHYDLNTCLREAIVILKSFLVTLPQDSFPDFQRRLRPLPSVPGRPNQIGFARSS